MNEAMIGLIAALGAVLLEKLADYILARANHKEQKADRDEAKNDETLEEIKKIRTELKKLSREISDNQIKECRIRILRFEDEMRHNVEHSEEHFEQIIEDIDTYEIYCSGHPDFKNNKGHYAMKHIREVYDECAKGHKFL